MKLQALLDHAITRLFKTQEVIDSLNEGPFNNMSLITKWEIDDTGTSEYKQKLEKDGDTECLHIYNFFSSVKLQSVNSSEADLKIILQNPRPSLTLYCRPLRFVNERL